MVTQSYANTTLTVAFAALHENAFGLGSVLRGEGPKPMGSLWPHKALGKEAKDRGQSTSSSGSGSGAPDKDVDMDASINIVNTNRRGPSCVQE